MDDWRRTGTRIPLIFLALKGGGEAALLSEGGLDGKDKGEAENGVD